MTKSKKRLLSTSEWTFPTSWHVSVAAESIAAARFAQCGYDVSVQYGANQPEYDLMVAKGERMLKVSVKGSQDTGWGLSQSHLKNADYHGAIKVWEKRHNPRTVLCFVQFYRVKITQMPRIYLATPTEVADRLRATAKGRGDTILWEHLEWTQRAHGAGTIDEIPPAWSFSLGRVDTLSVTVS
jgi:hypothetical protein